MKRIAVFTSGGDAPGMNACIRAVVRSAIYHKLDIFGIEQGFSGMINGNFIEMNSRSVSNIIQRGGTILKTARSKEFKTSSGRKEAYKNLINQQVEGIIAIGGNGTYTGCKEFYEEFGIPVIGLPGTIDNDLYGTDYTIGYDTAINTALEAIDRIRDTADSNDRTFFVEVMGRESGFIALDVGLSGGAEGILIPEIETDVNDLINMLNYGWGRKKGSQLIVVAEGDTQGNVFQIAEKIKAKVPDFEYRITVLGHLQRGGSPSAKDRVLASRLGAAAVDALLEGKQNIAVGIRNNCIAFESLHDAVSLKKPINQGIHELAKILSL